MSKPRSRVTDYLVYLAVRIVVCVLQTLSNRAARTLAAGLAWLVHRVDRRHRRVALDNLRQAFPNRYTESELDGMVRATYRHLCNLLVEVSHLPRKMHRNNSSYYFDLGERRQTALDLLRSDRPVLVVSGHFGNWEMAVHGMAHLGVKVHAVTRPLDNPYLEAFLRRFRESTGQTILAKNGDLTKLQEALTQGGKIALLVDQNAGPRGQMVSFFGRPASALKGIALLALQYRAPLLVVGFRKVGEPMRYRVEIADVILPEDYAGRRAAAVREITQRYTSALESVIRMAPEQYFWLHNRWKQHSGRETGVSKAA